MNKPVTRALVIHSLCTVGKASLTNIMPIMSIRGIEVCPIPSVILSSHTGGFKDIAKVDSENFIKKATDSLNENGIDFDLNFIGYLGTREKVKETIEYLEEETKGVTIVDTIFGDNFKLYNGFDLEYVKELRKLIKLSDVITPNFTEAIYLTNREFKDFYSEDDIRGIVYDLKEIGANNIIITSVPSEEGTIGIALYDGKDFSIIHHEKLHKSYPGTGDIFTAVLCTEMLKGNSLIGAVESSSTFVEECIRGSMDYDYPIREGVLLERQLYRLL
ncbi:MAG: pyridoxamine kinase [Clostridium sp.]|uniref:pyridoxamine kinase n=1 Tax=Clostridium sp. TaxID=1506 RepID=UPI003F3BF462